MTEKGFVDRSRVPDAETPKDSYRVLEGYPVEGQIFCDPFMTCRRNIFLSETQFILGPYDFVIVNCLNEMIIVFLESNSYPFINNER